MLKKIITESVLRTMISDMPVVSDGSFYLMIRKGNKYTPVYSINSLY